jgi:Glycosyl transferase family 2
LQLSVLLPSHRSGLTAISRIAQVCSWAGPNIEVIVRDNSGDAEKREVISRFQSEYCKVICVDPCKPLENFSTLLRLAKGDFIFWPADDDFSFDRAIRGVSDVLEQSGKDPSVAGVTGHYVVETSLGSSIARYDNVDSDDPVARVAGYLSYGGPNVITYSAVRREMVERTYKLLTSMPFYLSFHDQIQSLLFVASGKYIQIPRILYAYDMGVWEKKETAEQRDIDYLLAAGLDPVVNTLQWLLCAFEGAVLIRNSDIIPDYPLAQRQTMADRWFLAKCGGFIRDNRSTFGSKFEDQAPKIRARLLESTGHLSFQGLLTEICSVIALFSQDKAQHYFEFWNAQINKSAVDRRQAPGSAAGNAA